MVEEVNSDAPATTLEKTPFDEWKPDFNSDFRLSKDNKFATIRCPRAVRDFIHHKQRSIGELTLAQEYLTREEPAEELLKTLALSPLQIEKTMAEIRARSTLKAVKTGNVVNYFFAQSLLSAYYRKIVVLLNEFISTCPREFNDEDLKKIEKPAEKRLDLLHKLIKANKYQLEIQSDSITK